VTIWQPTLDDEKTPTAPVDTIWVGNVRITSRYDKRDELVRMTMAVLALDEQEIQLIASLWCDSKCGHCYHVVLCPAWRTKRGHAFPRLLARKLGWIFLQLDAGGHNGISVNDADDTTRLADADPDWTGDWEGKEDS
jgi:hypothetical protein